MKTPRLPSALRTRRLISASRSCEPGGGRLLQNFPHSSSSASSANDHDGMTNGPGVTEAIRPSKIAISQAASPTSNRKVVVRNRPRLTSASSSLTRCLSTSIIPNSPACLFGEPATLASSLCRFAAMMGGIGSASIGYNQAHTSARLAAQAASSATLSATWRRSQEI